MSILSTVRTQINHNVDFRFHTYTMFALFTNKKKFCS